MDIFEYNEVCWPTRALQQEEEEQAVAGAEQNLLPPVVKWTEDAAHCASAELLVVALSPASSALLTSAVGVGAQAVAEVTTPAAPTNTGSGGNKAEAAVAAAVYEPLPGVLVCCCDTTIPPEQAGAWSRGILAELQPKRLLLLGSMQAEQYRGEADASQELLAFVLQSTPLRQQQQRPSSELPGIGTGQPVAPYLPSGSIVSGLPAALITQAELSALPAELLVVVEQVPSLVPETLLQLARLAERALQQALSGLGSTGSQQWAASLVQSAVVERARLKLQRTAYRPSSVYS